MGVVAARADRDLVSQDFVGGARRSRAPGAIILVSTSVGCRMTAQARWGGFQEARRREGFGLSKHSFRPHRRIRAPLVMPQKSATGVDAKREQRFLGN
jgi:hypothetical protein